MNKYSGSLLLYSKILEGQR